MPLGEVIVSAPDRNRSGVGAALTLHDPVRARRVAFPVDGVTAYAVEGTPGDAVIMGIRKLAEGTVDVVVSGINPGHNVSVDLLVSGTVGGALHAYLNGMCAVAFSTAVVEDAESPLVARVARAIANRIPGESKGRPMLVNVNFPRLTNPAAQRPEVAGVTGVQRSVPSLREVDDRVEPNGMPGRDFYWILRRAAEPSHPSPSAGTDIRTLRDGNISVSGLSWDLSSTGREHDVDGVVSAARNALAGLK